MPIQVTSGLGRGQQGFYASLSIGLSWPLSHHVRRYSGREKGLSFEHRLALGPCELLISYNSERSAFIVCYRHLTCMLCIYGHAGQSTIIKGICCDIARRMKAKKYAVNPLGAQAYT